MAGTVIFPTSIFNRRIETLIKEFYEDMNLFFNTNGWKQSTFSIDIENKKWSSLDFDVIISELHIDGAYKTIDLITRLPTTINFESKGYTPIFGENHKITISLPREYPGYVNKIIIMGISSFAHPRFGRGQKSRPCLTVNGELSRILSEIVFQLLYKPENVRPPKLFKDSDGGIDHQAMKWYQDEDPIKVHEKCLKMWGKQRKHSKYYSKFTNGQNESKTTRKHILKILS